jgi:hypothetical protein
MQTYPNANTSAYAPIQAEPSANNIIALTARLAQVLAEEADQLEAMNIKKVGELQKEKLLLTGALEREKKLLERYPGSLASMTEEDKQDLRSVMEIFNAILAENYRRLLVAREVNGRVVDAISDAVNEATANSVYDKKAKPDHVARENLSVTLDEKA